MHQSMKRKLIRGLNTKNIVIKLFAKEEPHETINEFRLSIRNPRHDPRRILPRVYQMPQTQCI